MSLFGKTKPKADNGAAPVLNGMESGARNQAITVQESEEAALQTIMRGRGWMKDDEKVLAEFGKAHVYNKFMEKMAVSASRRAAMAYGSARHPAGGGIVSRNEARMDSRVQSAQMNADQAAMNNFKIDSAKTVLTDRRLVFLDNNEKILFELELGLERIKKHIQGVRAANEEAERKAEAAKEGKGFFDKRKETAKKYGYTAEIKWVYDANLDTSLFKRNELIIWVGHLNIRGVEAYFNPKYSDATQRRGWKWSPGKAFVYGPHTDLNVRLAKPEKVVELMRLLKSSAADVFPYTHDKTEMIVDLLGRRPDWLI